MPDYAVFQTLIEYPFPTTRPSYQVYQSVVETARPASEYLSVSGALGNNRIDGHVISLKRYASLCNPPQRGTLLLDTSFPRASINPAERIVLFEQGVRVLTGYVTKVTRERPSYNWVIDFEDEYTRVVNTFLADEMFYETATSMKYLIGQVLEPTGIRYRIGGSDWAVAPGTSIGLRSAHDALTLLCAYGGLYAWCDPDGLLRLRAAPSRKFQQNVQDPTAIQRAISTEQTRNDIHVYGGWHGDNETGYLVNTASYGEVEGLVTDLSTVVANPLLTTYSDAQRVSDYLLRELGSLTDVLTFETVGNPNLRIGTSGSLYHMDSAGVVTSGSGAITSMETTIDDKGYVMNVTINERCPRIAGWTQNPNEMRALWIACRGGGTDPRIEKLIWTGDFGLGGQPTYNIVKTIPPGMIAAMHVTRNGERVYLLMDDRDGKNFLWYSDNPYFDNVEWKLLFRSGSSGGTAGGGDVIDGVGFGTNAVTSMQIIGNDLHFAVRTMDSTAFPHKWFQIYGIVYSGTDHPVYISQCGRSSDNYYGFVPSGVATKGVVIKALDNLSTVIRGYAPTLGMITKFSTPAAAEFNTTLNNGVSIVTPNRSTGNMWRPDNNESHLLYTGFLDHSIYDLGTVIYTDAGGNLAHGNIHIRGDYWGGQYQFVDNLGRLYIGQFGSSPSEVFQWHNVGYAGEGCVNCLDKQDPKRLAWIPRETGIANEVARYSHDGGVSWENMTGNWWGSNADVLSGRKMQSQGDFLLIDAHPTFWSSEIIPDDGA